MDTLYFSNSQETPYTNLSDQSVAILGLGLMGASLALALQGKTAALLGIDPDPFVRDLAVQRGIVDKVAEHPAELLPESTLVILAAPVRSIISLVHDLPDLHPGQAVVIDLGSTKVEITQAMSSLPERLSPVGGHPMCGKETNSIINASADLYIGAPFVLTALSNSTPNALRLAEKLATSIGARPLQIDPAQHDRWVAATSHLPYLLASALAYCTPLECAPLVGPGFRSTARLAASSQRMMLDIFVTNRANILSSLGRYRNQLAILENALIEGDFSIIEELIRLGAVQYEELIKQSDKTANQV